MYEPIRTKSVHTMADPEIPHRSREQELDIRLAGQLTALLTVTDELHALAARMGGGGRRTPGWTVPGRMALSWMATGWTATGWPPLPSASPSRWRG